MGKTRSDLRLLSIQEYETIEMPSDKACKKVFGEKEKKINKNFFFKSCQHIACMHIVALDVFLKCSANVFKIYIFKVQNCTIENKSIFFR